MPPFSVAKRFNKCEKLDDSPFHPPTKPLYLILSFILLVFFSQSSFQNKPYQNLKQTSYKIETRNKAVEGGGG